MFSRSTKLKIHGGGRGTSVFSVNKLLLVNLPKKVFFFFFFFSINRGLHPLKYKTCIYPKYWDRQA